ncbi:MAG: phosphate signaling complex protein PhoU [Armatimonadaceae bacterium]
MAVMKSKTHPDFGDSLRFAVMEMALLAEAMLGDAIDALQRQDKALAEQVIERDDQVDHLESKLENRCLDAMAKRPDSENRQRLIATTLKLAADIEHIADLAVDIAKVAVNLADEAIYKPLVDVPRLSTLARNMLRDALDAFLNRDPEQARLVCLSEIDADYAYGQMRQDLRQALASDSHSIVQATHLLFVVHFLERICDHCAKIAQRSANLEFGRRRAGS